MEFACEAVLGIYAPLLHRRNDPPKDELSHNAMAPSRSVRLCRRWLLLLSPNLERRWSVVGGWWSVDGREQKTGAVQLRLVASRIPHPHSLLITHN